MILDERSEFGDALALNGDGAGTVLIGDVMDLGSSRPVANGEPPMYLVIQVDTAVDSAADNTTVNLILASDAQAAIAVDGSATVHAQTGVKAQSVLTAGKTFVIPLPPGTYERYLGILQTTGVAAVTAGKINAFLTRNPAEWQALDNGL